MATREIPRGEWVAFLDSFSRQHKGWLSTVEMLGTGFQGQIEVRERALIGITAELQAKQESVISILIGGKSDVDHLAHIIREPLQLWLKETEEGAHEALRIEAKNREITLLRFRSPMLPELVDGIVQAL